MSYDFDRVIERRGTGSLKWVRYGGRDVIAMWVADMDFPAPPAVPEALGRMKQAVGRSCGSRVQ